MRSMLAIARERVRRRIAELGFRALRRRAAEFDREALARSCVVIAPHPDDEVLACGGTIIEKKRAGADVRVVFVTDGSRSHPIDPAELRALRKTEALAAANVLGLTDGDLSFLDFEDGDLPRHVTAASERLRALLEQWRPAQVFAPCEFEWHPDHVATHDVAVRAIAGSPGIELYEYAVYLWRAWPWSRVGGEQDRGGSRASGLAMAAKFARRVSHAVTSADVERKRAALRAHRTQIEKRDPSWWTLGDWSDGDFVHWSTTGVELFCRR